MEYIGYFSSSDNDTCSYAGGIVTLRIKDLKRLFVVSVVDTSDVALLKFMIPYIAEDVMLGESLSRMPPSTMELSYC